MAKHILSKSTFIKGDQCLKQLYLYKKRYFLRDKIPRERIAKFRRGTNIGILARDLFPGGIDVSPKSPSQYQQSVQQTTQLIDNGQTTIYEATFQYDGVLVMLDILHKDKNGWKAYEVKSSKSINETYIKDAALQFHVIANAGINLTDFHLIHVNTSYIFNGELDLHQYFTFHPVLKKCMELSPYIEKKIQEEKEILTRIHSPDIPVGKHCFTPYDCDFIGHCWKKQPPNNIFTLAGSTLDKQQEFYGSGMKEISSIKDTATLKPIQQAQYNSLLRNSEYVDTHNLLALLQPENEKMLINLQFAFPPLPVFNNTSPYEAIPGILSYTTNGHHIENIIFTKNPAKELAVQLHSLLDQKNQKIFTLPKSLMHTLLERIEINQIDESWIFLEDIFSRGYYFHPSLRADQSIGNISSIILKSEIPDKMEVVSDELCQYSILEYWKNPSEETFTKITQFAKWKVSTYFAFYQHLINLAKAE